MISRTQSASGSGRASHRMTVIFPERRRERRYVTLKNAGIAGIALIVVFLLLSLWSAFRPHSATSRNLISSGGPSPVSRSVRDAPAIVDEGSIYDHPGTESTLLDPGALDQLQAAALATAAPAPSTIEQTNFEHRDSQLGKGQRITISGGSEGIQVRSAPMPAPSGTSTPAQGIQASPPPR